MSYFVPSNFKLDNIIRRASATSLEGRYFHYQKTSSFLYSLWGFLHFQPSLNCNLFGPHMNTTVSICPSHSCRVIMSSLLEVISTSPWIFLLCLFLTHLFSYTSFFFFPFYFPRPKKSTVFYTQYYHTYMELGLYCAYTTYLLWQC